MYIFCTATAIAILFGIVVAVDNLIYRKDRVYRHVLENRMSLEEILNSTDLVLATEVVMYERYLEDTGNAMLTNITNSEFVNIYNDLSRKILASFDDKFYQMASLYFTKEEFQSYLVNRVYDYLSNKIKANDE